MKNEYKKVLIVLIIILTVLLITYSLVKVVFIKELSFNLISELAGIIATIYIVDLTITKSQEKREHELNEKQQYIEWKASLERDKQNLVRFLNEIAEMLQILIEDLNSGEHPDLRMLRVKLSNPPLSYSFDSPRLTYKSKLILNYNLHMLNSIEFDVKKDITSKQLVDYRSDINRLKFAILQITDDENKEIHIPEGLDLFKKMS